MMSGGGHLNKLATRKVQVINHCKALQDKIYCFLNIFVKIKKAGRGCCVVKRNPGDCKDMIGKTFNQIVVRGVTVFE